MDPLSTALGIAGQFAELQTVSGGGAPPGIVDMTSGADAEVSTNTPVRIHVGGITPGKVNPYLLGGLAFLGLIGFIAMVKS
ncbi:MAG: hypothetical protein HQL69_20450 [Magnetococcales bacterium]|nr:hypothetical protein [Magnetococcales bacterium]